MKLHIGPGTTYLPGWVNVDIFSNVRADVYSSALALPYERGTFELIYASHVLEHFNRHLILTAISHWRDLLMEEGILRLAVPDFKAIWQYYGETGKLKNLIGLLYGGQDNFNNYHHIVFDEDMLFEILQTVGFKTVRKWDWKTTEHQQFDDYSQAYLPHMDKESGLHMSLNMEAIK